MIEGNPENQAKINRVADALLGSQANLEDQLREEFGDHVSVEDIPHELLDDLHEVAAMCDTCGFWCDAGYIDDNNECGDCRDDYHGD